MTPKPNRMAEPIYLIHYSRNTATGRMIHQGSLLNFESDDDVLELEKYIKEKSEGFDQSDCVLVLSITRLPQDTSMTPDDTELTPDDNIRFIVNNITTKTSHPFEYRHEAIDFYNASVAEKGDGAEYELLMRLKHHVPGVL